MVDEEMLAAAPKLKFVAHAAGTVKPVMSEAAWKRGIRCMSGAGAIAYGVSEFCLGLMLTAAKRTYWLAQRTRQGAWNETLAAFGPAFEIYRQKIGIIAASAAGKLLIELLKPFNCQVLLYDPYCTDEAARAMGVTKVGTLDEIFSQCLVVSLNAPVTEETKGMIRGSHFAQLPRGALFINTARGILINEEEMIAELRKGKFVACLDVTNPEPPLVDSPLRTLPNVLLTPHVAGAVSQNMLRIGEWVADAIEAYVQNRQITGEVRYEQLATMA